MPQRSGFEMHFILSTHWGVKYFPSNLTCQYLRVANRPTNDLVQIGQFIRMISPYVFLRFFLCRPKYGRVYLSPQLVFVGQVLPRNSSISIQSYCQRMIGGVQSPPKRIVFRIGSMKPFSEGDWISRGGGCNPSREYESIWIISLSRGENKMK